MARRNHGLHDTAPGLLEAVGRYGTILPPVDADYFRFVECHSFQNGCDVSGAQLEQLGADVQHEVVETIAVHIIKRHERCSLFP